MMGGSTMKRKQHNQHDSKVIPFPNLKERYFEKGIASMEAQDFEDAVEFLHQAYKLDKEDSRIAVTYLVAQYQNRSYTSAKLLAEQLLQQGIGDYYEVLEIYLTVLIQLKDHETVVKTIEALMDEKVVPPDKEEQLLTLLQLSKKVSDNSNIEVNQPISLDLDFSNIDKLPELAIQLGSLADKNIHPYLPTLLQVLNDQSVHPFLKTIVFNVLREHKIDQHVQVNKLDMEDVFNPTQVPDLHETPLFKEVNKELTVQLENENPVLLLQLQDMMQRHAFILYPFEYSHPNTTLWVVAYKGMGLELYGEEWSLEELAQQNGLNVEKLTEAYTYLLELEKISSPIV